MRVKDEHGNDVWECPECGMRSYIVADVGAIWRWHEAECSWLWGLDAHEDGSYNEDAVVDTDGQDYV
jgi:hypothetical protein